MHDVGIWIRKYLRVMFFLWNSELKFRSFFFVDKVHQLKLKFTCNDIQVLKNKLHNENNNHKLIETWLRSKICAECAENNEKNLFVFHFHIQKQATYTQKSLLQASAAVYNETFEWFMRYLCVHFPFFSFM